MDKKWRNMSLRVPEKIFKELKIKLIEEDRTFQDFMMIILIEYLSDNLLVKEFENLYKEPIKKNRLKKTLTFRIEEKSYKNLKRKLIYQDQSFQEKAEIFILAYLDNNIEFKNRR